MSIPSLEPLIDLGDGANDFERPADYLMARSDISTLTARLGGALRTGSELAGELRALAGLVVAVRRRSQFGVVVHRRLALAAGIEPALADALVAGAHPGTEDARQALIIRVTDSLLATGRISGSLYHEARQLLGDPALADLVALVGYHALMAMTITAYRDEDRPARRG